MKNWHRASPALLTLLAFLLAQVLGSLLLLAAAALASPDARAAVLAYVSGDAQGMAVAGTIPVSYLALALMTGNLLALLACHFLLHSIRPVTLADIARINWRAGLTGIAGGIFGAMGISTLTDNVELPDMMKQLSLDMSHDVWGLLALTIVGPLTEEILFREAVEGEMLRRGVRPWTAIGISALTFSLAHLNLAQGIYALPLGILFGIIYCKTGNIVLTTILHILNNGIAAMQLRSMGEHFNDRSPADWFGSTTATSLFAASCSVLCLAFTWAFWNRYRPHTEKKKHGHP